MTTPATHSWRRPFNSPIETGLRALCLLVESFPDGLGLQRLVQYEYLAVHSGDAEGPPSLHPAIPHRTGELLVRRAIVEVGVRLMVSRGLADQVFSPRGITYSAADAAAPFLDALTAQYTQRLRERCEWVVGTFASVGDDELDLLMRRRWDQWGSEFLFDPVSGKG